jgi:alpha-ribazole phosphatase
MEIYLIRHTTPHVATGTCYGQANLDVTESFVSEADAIETHLPPGITKVFSSPLQRCHKLAIRLFPNHTVITDPQLMELNCGHWELKLWDDIPAQETAPWMQNFVHEKIPGGESYLNLYHRSVAYFNQITNIPAPIAVVTHAGVIRSLLTFITGTALVDSFDNFKLHYGCIVKLTLEDAIWKHKVLLNTKPEMPERHRPSSL